MQKSEYQNIFAISQSAIKAFKTKPLQKFKEIYIDKIKDDDDEDQDKYAFGSLVDTLAFEPDLLDKRFFISDEDVAIPGEKVKIVLDKTFRQAKEIVENKIKLNEQGNLPELLYVPDITDANEWQDLIIQNAKNVKLGGTTWTNSRIVDNVLDNGFNYFRMLGRCNDRAIITPMDNAEGLEIVKILQTNKDTYKYFVQQEDETLLFQQEVYIDYTTASGVTVPLKGAIDIIRFDHKAKTVEAPDLKTNYSPEFFLKSARSFDYVTQADFYRFLLSEFVKTYEEGKYKDYEVLLPFNIVIDKQYKIPYIYQYRLQDLEIIREGSASLNVEGWINILETIAWHIETCVWDKTKEFYENGKIILKIFNTNDAE